jgi:hypothetical protein
MKVGGKKGRLKAWKDKEGKTEKRKRFWSLSSSKDVIHDDDDVLVYTKPTC